MTSTHVQHSTQTTHKSNGRLDNSLTPLLKAGEPYPSSKRPEDLDAQTLTALFSGFVTGWSNVSANQTVKYLMEIDFDTAATGELELLVEMSNLVDLNGNKLLPGVGSHHTSNDANGRKLTHPEVIVYQRANYTAQLVGSVLTVYTMPFLVPDDHCIRISARMVNFAGAPTFRIWKMGGQGL